ncbi:MAG: family 43 glycosylhydrolase [Oscillospiraceae bacterium]|nr:family 43 glycosylhydrolase [Oscillospiraceae bacterium]
MKRLALFVLICITLIFTVGCNANKDNNKSESYVSEAINPHDFGVPRFPIDFKTVLHYDMSHYSYMLFDMSGYGNHGIMHNISDDDFTQNGDDDILKLPGTDGSYIEIPLSVSKKINYKKGFTVEMTFTPRTNQHQFLWSLGTGYQTDYLRINPAGPYGGYFETTIKTQSNNNNENTLGKTRKLSEDEMSVVTVTYDGEYFDVYVNGDHLGYTENKHDLSAIFAGNGQDILGYIAKSNWDDPYCDSVITDFKIYNKTLDEKEIKEIYDEFAAKQRLRLDIASIKVPKYTYENLTLPSEGENGAAISWKSSNKKALSESGVIAPEDEDKAVTLTAVFTDESTGVWIEKTYDIIVVAKGDEGRLNFTANNFDLGISRTADDIKLVNEVDGVTVTWQGSELIDSQGHIIKRNAADTETTLKATLTYNGTSIEKEYPITVIGNSGYTLATYIAGYEPRMGSEFAEFPSGRYTDNARTDVMYYAISQDGVNYTSLNNDKAVLSPETSTPTFGVPFAYQLGSPNIFRKPDGSYGVIASNNNDTPSIILFDSNDLIFFNNQREIKLNDEKIAVINPTVKYNNLAKLYEIYWEGGDGKSYVSYTSDLKNITETKEAEYTKPEFSGSLPVYAKTEEATEFILSQDEYDRIMRKYSPIQSIGVKQIEDITVNEGDEVTLPEYVTVEYSDGSTKNMAVTWNVDSLELAKGEYEITGTIENPIYDAPFARFRADPQIQYVEKDDKYYFTSSYMQGDTQNAYRYVILRSADTISGLSDAEGGNENEVIIWSEYREGDANPWYWAPEMHYFGGKYNILFLSTYGEQGWRMTIISCDGNDDPMNPDNWSLTGTVNPDGNGKYPGAFDTTFFKYNGQCYYVSPSSSSIWIAKFDENDPLNMTSNLVRLSACTYPWEYNVGQKGTICDHQYVEEGSYVMIHEGRIFITYAAATVDTHYAIGLLYADLNSDLTDPDNWHKYPQPLLTTSDLTTVITEPQIALDGSLISEGEYQGPFGPGHNSITYDEFGNAVVVYHARVWGENYVGAGAKYGLGDPGRHAFVGNIHWSYDGFPVLNMSAEQQLAEALKTVKVKVIVK